jgi:hypothetical protein
VKSIKMLGLAAIAALMAMAFVGASSAMATDATALCTADESPCADANLATHVHETTNGTKATLLSSTLNVECEVLFLGDVQNDATTGKKLAENTPLIIKGNFTYSSCNSGCTVSEENGPVTIKVLHTGAEESEVTGEGLVHVNCSGFINCRYTGTGLKGLGLGPLLAGGNGSVSLSGQETTKESGSLCPSKAFLDITTTALTANKAWISN